MLPSFFDRWLGRRGSGFPLALGADAPAREGGTPTHAAPFTVVAMFTDSYEAKAERLRRSCERWGLAHALWKFPAVHESMSRHGSEDPRYTKANFIRNMLARLRGPVLYVDADCEFRAFPELVVRLLEGGCEFAIYNWAADEHTEAYVPVSVVAGPGGDAPAAPHRYFRFGTKFDHYDPRQLLCSGPVQLYSDTPAAHALLEAWHATVLAQRGSADDHCLDYAFNNRGSVLAGMRFAWLPKEYARYAWWIYVKPIIDHPEFAAPGTHFVPIRPEKGRRQFDFERAQRRDVAPIFPPGWIVDAHERRLLRVEGKAIVQEQPIAQDLWVSGDAAP